MKFLQTTGSIWMPPGATQADITVVYNGALRGNGKVAGGTVKATAGSDGIPFTSDKAVLSLWVAEYKDVVDRHPYAHFAVSFRGAPAKGYEFDVDLAVAPGTTRVDISKPVGTMIVMSAAQVADLLARLNQASLNGTGPGNGGGGPSILIHGLLDDRRSLVVSPERYLMFFEDDTHRQINYFPGIGWRDVYGNDPDAPPPVDPTAL